MSAGFYMKAKLYYVYDPMCSWCWGYAPIWKRLAEKLSNLVDIQYCLGGLAEDTEQIMTDEMQQFLQQTWQKISQQLGTKFNFDFWQVCQPRRSTYPACRAALIARQHNKEAEMLTAIQHAYYLQARNPSNSDVLSEIAADIGLNVSHFIEQLTSEKLQKQLIDEVDMARTLPIRGFPSLVLFHNNQYLGIAIDYKNWQSSFDSIIDKIELN